MKLTRVASISATLAQEGLDYLTHTHEGEDDHHDPGPEVATRLRHTLEKLGPTFVKFGQLLATRVDLFDEAFLAELAKLHSEVEPFPTADARRIVEEELERPIDEVFAAFSDEPVAAASIAQVYKATLASDGSTVAVKVQRPGLEEVLLADLDALMFLSRSIDRLVPPYRRAMVHRVAEEYATRARAECDFLAEAKAIRQFADVLTTLPEFRIPQLYPSLSTPRLLVMEWMEGTKLGELSTARDLVAHGFDPDGFGRSMLRLQLSMCYEHGFVHGDTHPGNIFLMPSGQIALIDFGLHGHVSRQLRDKMLEFVFAVASDQVDDAVEAFVQVFQPDPTIDMDAFKAELRVQIEAETQVETVEEYDVTKTMIGAMRLGAKYRLRIDSDLFIVVRNLSIVQMILRRYCPTLDMLGEIKVITGGILRRRLFGPSMQEEFTALLPQLALTLSQRPRLAARLMKLERSFNEAKSLGEFLRRENVIEPPSAAGWSVGWVVAGLAIGLFLGTLLGFAMGSL